MIDLMGVSNALHNRRRVGTTPANRSVRRPRTSTVYDPRAASLEWNLMQPVRWIQLKV